MGEFRVDMFYGQVAYESYADDRDYRTFDDRAMPVWKDLPYEIQNAWRVAANTTIVVWKGKSLDGNN